MTRYQFHTWLIGHMHLRGRDFNYNNAFSAGATLTIKEFGDAVLKAAHSVPVYMAFPNDFMEPQPSRDPIVPDGIANTGDRV